MSVQPYHLLLILGMALVTYLPRALPLVLLSSRRLNPGIERWLRLIPPAVLAALLAPELFLVQSGAGGGSGVEAGPEIFVSPQNIMLLAAIPSFLVAWFGKSFFGTVITGMAAVALGRYFFNCL